MAETCRAEGCRARAWGGPFCSFHALERQRAARAATVTTSAVEDRRRREVREQAAALGLTLAREEVVEVAAAPRKRRSPVA